MNYDMVMFLRLLETFADPNVVRGTIHELRIRDQRGRLRQPSGIPVAGDFTASLVTGPGSAVKPVEAGR